MRVVCVFPMFPVEKHYKNIPKIINECKKEIFPKLCMMGAISPDIRFSNINYTYVETNQILEGEPKGKGVLECLKNYDKIDCVILCDGSGAIPFRYIIDVFQELISDPNINCVMTNRKGNKAINEFRYLIERFEVFMIKRFFNHKQEIPDGQCGLWGYKLGKIKLTSEGYELELDLLGEVLKNNLQYSFIDIELPPRKVSSSSYNYKDNLSKMKFFLDKYPRLKDCVSKYIEDFKQEKAFIGRINKTVKKKEWNKYKTDILNLIKKQK